MRPRLVAVALVVAVAFTSAVAAPARAADGAASTQPAYLFAFDGKDATVAPVAGEKGTFTLTVPITRGNRLVTWFTDRPIRDAGHITMPFFVDFWVDSGEDGFAANPPNVAIAFGSRTVIATMTDPEIVTAKDGSRSLVSTMTVVKGEALEKLAKSGKHLAAHAKRAQGAALPNKLTLPSVSVFVDDSSGNTCTGWIACCQTINSVPGASCTITVG